jgi:hypothetical protein
MSRNAYSTTIACATHSSWLPPPVNWPLVLSFHLPSLVLQSSSTCQNLFVKRHEPISNNHSVTDWWVPRSVTPLLSHLRLPKQGIPDFRHFVSNQWPNQPPLRLPRYHSHFSKNPNPEQSRLDPTTARCLARPQPKP